MDIEKVVMAWKISGLFQLPANEQRYAVMGNERPSKESFSLSQLKVFAEKGQISKTTFVSDGLASDNYDNIESEHARWFPSVMIHGLFSIAHNDSFYLEQIKGRRVDALGPFSLKQLNTMQGIIHENTKISVWNTQPWLSKEIEVDGPYMGNTQKWVKAKSIPGLENLPLDYAHMRKEPIREIYRKGDALPFYGNPDLSRYDVTEEDVEDIAAELKNGELVPGRGDEYSALRNLKTFYELKFHKIPRF